MSKAQHTPGPWFWKNATATSGKLNTVSVQEIYADRGEHIYEMVAYTTENVFGSDTRIGGTDANARLIAAAPDLLDALHSALPFVEDALDSQYYKAESVRKVLAQIRAAIAKAMGETK